MKVFFAVIAGILISCTTIAQTVYELNSGWYCAAVGDVKADGTTISQPGYAVHNWLPATVPGTVLTTLLNNQKIPDPFYGMHNEQIRDIYFTGNAYYTYWFVKDFKETAKPGEEVWLQLRGINYTCEVFVNGHLIDGAAKGMFIRQQYRITPYLQKNGNNRIAVLVHPPDFPGNPNGGQGGDGTIAKGLTTQYTAGWDWIQPMRDRNTGIWDKVLIEKTNGIRIRNPHIITVVPGVRLPGKPQLPATVKITAEIENPGAHPVTGTLQYQLKGKNIRQQVMVQPGEVKLVSLADCTVDNPRLWWPNGYGEQYLYTIQLEFIAGNKRLLDKKTERFGIRQTDYQWNAHTQSMQTMVNGQNIFIKGGNWIISDAMLRFSEERYEAEIRFHRDMNLNLIRIWGGALTERPEFYEACDKYGLLVMQDFWFSGDCNGKWLDPMKKEDQWQRRKYPDDHALVLKAMADQVKMIRNHPSLIYWCGGNEITPPVDILQPLKDSILPRLDGTRYLFDYSNSDSMSMNMLGGNGDGPYNIQDPLVFWQQRTFPFNSEVGSVGTGDLESLERFIPLQNLVPPAEDGTVDTVWQYHRYIPYEKYIQQYGKVKDVRDFTMKAQLVNYNQYRALMEGFSSHMWDWYTGSIIWKTQNPWTALRGQMYDYYLDVNACLYGLRKGSEPLHIMMDPQDSMVMVVNNGFVTQRNLMIEVKVYDVLTGRDTLYTRVFSEAGPSVARKYFSINGFLRSLNKKDGVFVHLRLLHEDRSVASENLYWLPAADGQYTALQQMPAAALQVSGKYVADGKVEITLRNPSGGPVAFFNRVALTDKVTGKRLLPVFYTDNYISVLPGQTQTIEATYPVTNGSVKPVIRIYGWNVPPHNIDIK